MLHPGVSDWQKFMLCENQNTHENFRSYLVMLGSQQLHNEIQNLMTPFLITTQSLFFKHVSETLWPFRWRASRCWCSTLEGGWVPPGPVEGLLRWLPLLLLLLLLPKPGFLTVEEWSLRIPPSAESAFVRDASWRPWTQQIMQTRSLLGPQYTALQLCGAGFNYLLYNWHLTVSVSVAKAEWPQHRCVASHPEQAEFHVCLRAPWLSLSDSTRVYCQDDTSQCQT